MASPDPQLVNAARQHAPEAWDTLLKRATLCALARYRLANGTWPGKLESLVPAFLPAVPSDIFTGQPVRYDFLPAGGTRLYSVGPNGRDDDGKNDDIVLTLRSNR
ncbi:MAG: hypothetical protein ABIO94_04670 [Opitutaceae bacterium]